MKPRPPRGGGGLLVLVLQLQLLLLPLYFGDGKAIDHERPYYTMNYHPCDPKQEWLMTVMNVSGE